MTTLGELVRENLVEDINVNSELTKIRDSIVMAKRMVNNGLSGVLLSYKDLLELRSLLDEVHERAILSQKKLHTFASEMRKAMTCDITEIF